MIRFTMLMALLYSNISLSEQNFQEAENILLAELSTTKDMLKEESLEWERKFYQSLIEDEDPNIKLLGLSKIISGFYGINNNISFVDIATEINAMITSEKLSHKSIGTITTMCSSKQLMFLCDQDAIFDKQNNAMSDNAYIYLSRLDLAYKEGNQNGIKQAIDDIAESKYIDVFMYLHEGFRTKLENYVKDNPFPENKLAMENFWITRFAHLNADEQEEISDNMEEIMIFSMVVGSKLAESIPAFRNLVNICKSNTKYEKSCIRISDIFINKSKTIISVMIGYAIKIEILKQSENIEELKLAEKAKTAYKAKYECLAKIMGYGSTYTSHTGVKFSRIAEPIERKFGEIAFFESLAKLNYDYYSGLGDENIINPESCAEKL